jgi:hypothetical protein
MRGVREHSYLGIRILKVVRRRAEGQCGTCDFVVHGNAELEGNFGEEEMIKYKKETSIKVIIYTKTRELENISKFLCPTKRK